jgi:hypothetical protein
MKNLLIALATILAIINTSVAISNNNDDVCSIIECKPGSKVIAKHSDLLENYNLCQSKEVAHYLEANIGVITLLTLEAIKINPSNPTLPETSPVTGEPIVDGAARNFLDKARKMAGVESVDNASNMCDKEIGMLFFTVLDNPKELFVIWVADIQTHKTYWIGKSNLHLLQNKH